MNILNDYPYRIEYKSRNEPMRIKKKDAEKRISAKLKGKRLICSKTDKRWSI